MQQEVTDVTDDEQNEEDLVNVVHSDVSDDVLVADDVPDVTDMTQKANEVKQVNDDDDAEDQVTLVTNDYDVESFACTVELTDKDFEEIEKSSFVVADNVGGVVEQEENEPEYIPEHIVWDGILKRLQNNITYYDLKETVSEIMSQGIPPLKLPINVTFNNGHHVVDEIAKAELPPKWPENLVPAKTYGDGNCFPRACS